MKTTKYIKDLKENFIRISERQEKAILEYPSFLISGISSFIVIPSRTFNSL